MSFFFTRGVRYTSCAEQPRAVIPRKYVRSLNFPLANTVLFQTDFLQGINLKYKTKQKMQNIKRPALQDTYYIDMYAVFKLSDTRDWF